MNENTIQTCSEIYCLLEYFPESYVCKVPKKLLDLIKKNSNSEYFIEVDVNKPLEEQTITERTKHTLLALKYNYWSDEIEKRNIIEKLSNNERGYEEELREKFNSDNLFKKRNNVIEENQSNEGTSKQLVITEIKWYQKIFNKIKNLLKRN